MEDKAFRQAVGEVAQQAAILESVVAIVAWGMAGLDQRVARIVVPNNMDRMLTLIRDLLPLRVSDDGLRREVESWLTDVKATYARRSKVIHSAWLGDGHLGPHLRTDLRPIKNPATHTLERLEAADVRALASELEALNQGDRMTFIGKLADHVGGTWSVGTTEQRPMP